MAGSLSVHFPWGSLLRGILAGDDAVLAGMAKLLTPGAELAALVSVLPRDNGPAVPSAETLAEVYARHALTLVTARTATPSEIEASHSSWAKRLQAGSERPVTLLRARAMEDHGPERRTSRGRGRVAIG